MLPPAGRGAPSKFQGDPEAPTTSILFAMQVEVPSCGMRIT